MQGATGGAMDAGKDAAIQGGAQAVGPLVGTVAGPVAERLMNSALKPGVKLSLKAAASGEAPEVVKTLLKEGVSVTPGGAAKLERIVSATDDEISNAIAGITGQVNPLKVASRLTPTAKAFAQQVNPTSDLEAISKVGQEFLETHPTDIDLQTAQAIKKGTYKQLPGKAYGELKGAEIESQKALARGLKEEIEDEVGNSLQGIKGKLGLPGGVNISAANARQGAALQARDALARRLVTSQNHNPMGLASLAVSHPATFLAVLMDRNPGVKSLIARGLWGEAGRALKMSPQVVRLAVQTIATDDSTSETPQ
jgi:hypothetical protein